MACKDRSASISRQTVAVILLLCCLVPSSTCFSLRRLSKKVKQDRVISEATVTDVRTGRIFFNGKELNSPSQSSSAASATENERPMQDGPNLLGTGILTHTTSQLNSMANEAAWRGLNPSLHCSENQMKLKATGPKAADLKLQMGGLHPLPLSQVPETCGYSMTMNMLGLVLLVPYDGCNVIQQNGDYVLLMLWQETPVKFTCPMLSTPASTTPKPAKQPYQMPYPLSPGVLAGQQHDLKTQLSIYDPSIYYYLYNYYMYMMAHASRDIAAATPMPHARIHPQMKPPAYPSHMRYPPYIPHSHYPPANQLLPGTPANSGAYLYPVIQNYYVYPAPVKVKPTEPTTTFAPTMQTQPTSSNPMPTTSFVPYVQLPFSPPLSFNKSAKFPDDEKHMPRMGYKSGLQPRANPQPSYSWHPMPWFPSSTGVGYPQFKWKNVQPHQP